MSDDMSRSLQKERQLLQAKMYTSWLNFRLQEHPDKPQIQSLFEDLRDGKILLSLLSVLTGTKLRPTKGNMRLHHLNNLAKVFEVLNDSTIKIVGIHNNSICDGEVMPTLGLCWSIIYHFQVLQSMKEETEGKGNAEKALLQWCQDIGNNYSGAEVRSFQPSRWKNGFMLNAIIHSNNPKLFSYSTLTKFNDAGRIQHAVDIAADNYQVPKLFSPKDFEKDLIDSKTLVLYVSMLHEKMKFDKANKEKEESIEKIMAKIQGEIADVKKIVKVKERAELVNLPQNIPVEDMKKYQDQYPNFDKDTEELLAKLESIKGNINSTEEIPEKRKNDLNGNCKELEDELLAIKEKSKNSNEQLANRRLKIVEEELLKVTTGISTYRELELKIAVKVQPTASKEDLLECVNSAKLHLSSLLQMQAPIRNTCATVDEIFADESLPQEPRQALKNGTKSILDDYKSVMELLGKDETNAQTLLDSKKDDLNSKIADWFGRVNELDKWLVQKLQLQKGNPLKYSAMENLVKDKVTVETSLAELTQSWKKFQEIAQEWNSVLCDEVNDDKYADTLNEVQVKFNQLNKATIRNKDLIYKMLDQKTKEDALNSELLELKNYVNHKEGVLGGIDEGNHEAAKQEIQKVSKEVEGKEATVKRFLTKSNSILPKNTFEPAVANEIEDGIKEFCLQWDQLKSKLQEKDKKVDNLKHEAKKNKQSFLLKSLSDWQNVLEKRMAVLNGCDLHGESSMQDMSIAVTKLEALLTWMSDDEDKVKEFGVSFQKTVEELDPEMTSQLILNYDLFFKTWGNCGGKAAEILGSLQKRIEEGMKTEEATMQSLKDSTSAIATWCEKADIEIAVYCEDVTPVESMMQMSSDKVEEEVSKSKISESIEKELVERLSAEGKMIDGQLLHCSELVESDKLKSEQNKESVRQDILMYKHKKLILDAKLSQAQKLLDAMAIQNKKDEEIQQNLEIWRKYLTGQTNKLNNASGQKNLLVALQHVEELLSEINEKEGDVGDFLTSSGKSLKANKYTKEKSANMLQDVNSFNVGWTNFKGEIKLQKERIEADILKKQEAERLAVENAKGKVQQVEEWLVVAEDESSLYCEVPDDFDALEQYSSQFENLLSKLTDEEKDVDEKLQHAAQLAESEDVLMETNREALRKAVNALSQRKLALNGNLLNAQKWLTTARDQLNNAQAQELMKWFNDANAVKETLLAYENLGREDVIKTVNEGELALKKQQELMNDMSQHQPTIDNLLKQGEILLDKKKWGQAKENELTHEMKIVDQRWKALNDRVVDVLEGYRVIIVSLKTTSAEKVYNLLQRVNSFKEWLNFAKEQLHGGRKPSTFGEHIQRELGLKKLSTDLESRASEFDYLVKMAAGITVEEESQLPSDLLPPHENSVSDSVENLKNEWSAVIDNIDTEFKNLYEAINSLLDKRRAQIEHSLDLVKETLLKIAECGDDRHEMAKSAQIISDLTNELSSLKVNIAKLAEQTSSLNDVTVFLDNEKQLLIQSSDDLSAKYKECLKESESTKLSFRNALMDYFKRNCEQARIKITEFEGKRPVYDTDEEDLQVLKQYLLQDQEIMADVKAHHLEIDALEQFAEEVSSHGVLDANDQVSAAEMINEVLKAFEELRRQCKEGTNRVYAVTMHLFVQHLHSISLQLEGVRKDLENPSHKNAPVADFDQAINKLIFVKGLEKKLEETASHLGTIKKDIEAWSESNLIELPDVKKLQDKDTFIAKDLSALSDDTKLLKERTDAEAVEYVVKRLEEFDGWLPIVQKRKEEGNEIGPDFGILSKQIQEMKVIERQAVQISVAPLLEEKAIDYLALLSEATQEQLKTANSEWGQIKEWVDNRLETLERAEVLMEDFKGCKADLVFYLRDIENELKSARTIDLNDSSAVDVRSKTYQDVTSAMENRKFHVSNFVNIAEDLIDLINADSNPDDELQLPSSIRSEVADILDSWNNNVKRSIEMKTKLSAANKKFELLQTNFAEVREWITDMNDLLEQLAIDVSGYFVDKLVASIEKNGEKKEEIKKKLDFLIDVGKDLSEKDDIITEFKLAGPLSELNDDFRTTADKLEQLHKFMGKVRILSRRVRGGTRRIFNDTKERIASVRVKPKVEEEVQEIPKVEEEVQEIPKVEGEIPEKPKVEVEAS